MITAFDESMLRRTIRLAMNGRGRVEPNPMVGCVLTKDGRTIGEGWHAHFGGPHAEPTALADCEKRGNTPRGGTAYVTLEPCCHLNKKTPPCAPRLIKEGIARVVIGCLDPNPDVNGNGVLMLEKHGVAVECASGPLELEFKQLIAPFRASTFYTTLKWAQSADGYVAAAGGVPVRITGRESDVAVQRLRTRCDAIAVGINTVLRDDPRLTVRDVDVLRRPMRIVLDRQLRIPLDARLLTSSGRQTTSQDVIVLADAIAVSKNPEKAAAIRDAGGEVVGVDGYVDDPNAFLRSNALDRINTHLLIEPGPTLAASLLPVADRLWVFVSEKAIHGGPTAPRAADIPASYVETGRLTLGPDTLTEYLNTTAATFASPTASADLVLERDRLIPSPV